MLPIDERAYARPPERVDVYQRILWGRGIEYTTTATDRASNRRWNLTIYILFREALYQLSYRTGNNKPVQLANQCKHAPAARRSCTAVRSIHHAQQIQTGGSFLPTSSRRCSSWQPTRRSYHEDSPGIHRDPLQRATLILRTPAAILNRSQVFPLDSDLSDHPVAGRNTLPSFRSARAHRTAVISVLS